MCSVYIIVIAITVSSSGAIMMASYSACVSATGHDVDRAVHIDFIDPSVIVFVVLIGSYCSIVV